MNYNELTIAELKELCRERDLLVGGRKPDLVLRLEDSEDPEEKEVLEELEEPTKVEEIEESDDEEGPKVEMDIMPSETPAETPVVVTDGHTEARAHYVGKGHVQGEYLFDNVPGSIAANSEEEAFEKYRTLPGGMKVPFSH